MAKPYSDDFRQKVMQVIELDGLKKCEARGYCSISVATRLTCGSSAKPKRAMSNPNRGQHCRRTAKSMIGISSAFLSKNMGIKPRVKWRSYGTGRLASEQFPGHYEG